LSPDSVEAIAQGRIWTGKQALERNLVDELGGLREAVNKAVELAEIDSTDLHVKYYTEQEDLVNYVLRRLNVSMHATWAALFIGPERTALRDTQRLLESWAGKRDFVQLLCPVQLDY
jgi:protease-4